MHYFKLTTIHNTVSVCKLVYTTRMVVINSYVSTSDEVNSCDVCGAHSNQTAVSFHC